MILVNDLENFKSNDLIKMKCDYCDLIFERTKSNVVRGRRIIEKDVCCDRKCISIKSKESNMKKYGVSNPAKDKNVIDKKNKTMLERYGVIVPCKNEQVKNNMAQTNLKKYGNKCSLHGSLSKEKTKKTWQKNHGKDHPFKSPLIRKKIKDSMDEKYGMYYTRTQDYIEKTKDTCNKKYGTDHSSQSDIVKNKKKKTNLERFGCEFPSQNKDILHKIFKNRNQRTNYGKTQNEIKAFLEDISGLDFESIMIDKKEIDIFNSEINLGIEYCGLWWHNEQSPQPRNRNYHFNKYKICEEKNIRLITIFEDEWVLKNSQCRNYLKSIIGKHNNRFFARNCEIKIVENKVSNEFYSINHLMGKPYNTKISYGLFMENDMVGCISLGNHHRISSKTTINRLCFKPDVQVVGGVSKLFKRCVDWCKENNCNEIITWSDNRWSTGNTYQKIGFNLDKELKPDYSYTSLKKKNTRVSKQSKKNKTINEKEWATENFFAKIWDCGKKRWIYKI